MRHAKRDLTHLVVALAGDIRHGVVARRIHALTTLEWRVTLGAPRSRSRHTPFAGMMLPGRVCATVVSGRPAWETSA